MPKPTDNHGASVSAYVHELQAARVDGEPRGIGQQVSAFAATGELPDPTDPPVDFLDYAIVVVKDEGGSDTFTSFADALAYADDGDVLQVGQGAYYETFSLDASLTIIGEAGALIDGSGFVADGGTPATIQLYDGFSGGSISGLQIVAVENGNALVTIIGQTITGVELTGNYFDGAANASGTLVYLNPGADGFVFSGNTFEALALSVSPLLGIEGDNVQVTENTFSTTAGPYARVEVFAGADGVTTDVVFTGNVGIDPATDILYS